MAGVKGELGRDEGPAEAGDEDEEDALGLCHSAAVGSGTGRPS